MSAPDPARHFSIRPSRPEVQRARDAAKAEKKAHRASRRLEKAATVPKCVNAKPDDWRGFQVFWRSVDQRLLVGLSEEELQRVWQAAWAHHHALTYNDTWRKVLSALHDRMRAVETAEPPGYWRNRGLGGQPLARRDGW